MTEHNLLQLSAPTQNQPKKRGAKEQHKKKRDLSSSEEDTDNFSLASSGHIDFSLFDSEDETFMKLFGQIKCIIECSKIGKIGIVAVIKLLITVQVNLHCKTRGNLEQQALNP